MPQDEKDNSVLDFLNGVSDENSNKEVFKEDPVEEDESEEKKDEKPIPFHQDPKVQKYIEKQIEKALKDVKPSAEQTFKKDAEEIKLPASFVKLIGNDTEEKVQVLKDLSNYFGTLKGEARQEFLAEMQEQQNKAVAEDNAAVAELEQGFEDIKNEVGVDLSANPKLDSEFRAFIREIAPKDENGDVKAFPDLVASFKQFQELNKRPTATRAKDLAAKGLTRSNDAAPKVPTGSSWKDVDRFFETLKKTQ